MLPAAQPLLTQSLELSEPAGEVVPAGQEVHDEEPAEE